MGCWQIAAGLYFFKSRFQLLYIASLKIFFKRGNRVLLFVIAHKSKFSRYVTVH